MNVKEVEYFNGVKYRLMGAGKYYLSQSTTNEGRKRAKGLHVAIWEHHHNEEVPKGFHVHHLDGDTFNNDISNLGVVCEKKHLSYHSKKSLECPEYRANNKKQLDDARVLASEWHASEEGREWHKKHYEESLAKAPTYQHTCKQCGDEIISRKKTVRFCSDLCGERWRAEHNRVKYKAICQWCGEEFTATKAKISRPNKKTCSLGCGNKLANKNKREKKESST